MEFTTMSVHADSLTGTLARPEDLEPVQEFRIASYNVWNMFGEEYDLNTRAKVKPKPEEQLEALAEKLYLLDVDAIGFQEVQNELTLKTFIRERVNARIKAENRKFSTFVCIPANDRRGINVAFATRFAVRGALTFHDREFGPPDDRAVRFSRDLLALDLNATPEYRFLFFVAHLKSKIGGTQAAEKRELEADEIRQILESPPFGGKPYIEQDLVLCGDMNDDPDSETVRILKEGRDSKGILLRDVLGNLISYPTHERYKPTRLDYILASPSLLIEHAEVREEGPAEEASDHYPVSATVRVKS